MKVGIYTRCRDEENIIEFIDHYFNLGFSSMLIVDHMSNPCVKEIIKDNNYFDKIYIYRIDKNEQTIDKLSSNIFKNNILPLLKNLMDYCLYVDVDEYLVIKNFSNITEVINYYEPFDMLKINWLFFGNNYIKSGNCSKLKDLFIRSDISLNNQVKSLVKLESVLTNSNPHYFKLLKGKKTKNIMNLSSDQGPYDDSFMNISINQINIYLAHYCIQTTEKLLNRKFTRITDHIRSICDEFKLNQKELVEYLKENINFVIEFIHDNYDEKKFNQKFIFAIIKIKNYFNWHNRNKIINYDLKNELNNKL